MSQAFNLSQLANKVNTSGELDPSTGLSGPTPVAKGGTGLATLTSKGVMIGNGTSSPTFVAPGASGNVLKSNGTNWQSVAAGGYVGLNGQVFTSNGTFTIPSGITAVKVTMVGGGGGGGATGYDQSGGGGGAGGTAYTYLSGLTSGLTLNVTIGGGGGVGSSSGTSGAGGTTSISSGTQTISTSGATGGGGGEGGDTIYRYPGGGGGSTGAATLGVAGNGGLNTSGGVGMFINWGRGGNAASAGAQGFLMIEW